MRVIVNRFLNDKANKINVFDVTPITFAFDMDDDDTFDDEMHRFTKFFIKHCGDPKKYASADQAVVKKGNAKVLFTYEFKQCRGKVLNIMSNFNEEKNVSPYLRPKLTNTYYAGGNMWLLKPTGLNRGRGIELFNTLEDLNKYINQYLEGERALRKQASKEEEEDDEEGEDGGEEEGESEDEEKEAKKGPPRANFRSRTFVIQKYIEHPLLVYQRKFDIRAFAMVTHDMHLYFFK